MSDTVDHPAHYNVGRIEVIDAIEDWQLDFHAGNVVKYVARAKHKNGIEDLRKAAWYLKRLIENQERRISDALQRPATQPAKKPVEKARRRAARQRVARKRSAPRLRPRVV